MMQCKKIVSFILCFVLGMSLLNINTSKAKAEEYDQTGNINARLVSIEYNDGSDIVPYGTFEPGSSKIKDLSKEDYKWTVDTHGTVIYSNYMFTGHDGRITISGTESSGNQNSKFTMKIHVKEKNTSLWPYKTYTYECQRGMWFQFSMLADEALSTDYIYFAIDYRDGEHTLVTDGICKKYS